MIFSSRCHVLKWKKTNCCVQSRAVSKLNVSYMRVIIQVSKGLEKKIKDRKENSIGFSVSKKRA